MSPEKCTQLENGEGTEEGVDGGSTSYRGKRTDLRDYSSEDSPERAPPLPELRRIILGALTRAPHGMIASEFAIYGVSKSWARRVLNRMVDEGLLRIHKIRYGGEKQLHIFFINEEKEMQNWQEANR